MHHVSSRRRLILLGLSVAAFIFFTRMVTITHNWVLHPDEHVFYLGANSLLNAILHPGLPFEEFMEYPEGAYYFHAVFQLLGKVVSALTGTEQNLQFWGRVAAVFYFTAAVFLGLRLLHRYLGKSTVSLVFYGLSMCFSLFFLEQSRYGTGDMISLMLLMLLLNLTANALSPEARAGWWIAAFFVCGVLGAVKYPLLVFTLIPLLAVFSQKRQGRSGIIAVSLLAVILGFFLFSPKAMADPAYILRVIRREGNSYMGSGPLSSGGPVNHLLSLLVYSLLYAEFPLLLPLVFGGFAAGILGFLKHRGTRNVPSGPALLFQVILPAVCLLFFLYNLFVGLLFFRTYTPFFGIMALYSAIAAESLWLKKGCARWIVLGLAGFLVLRGGWMVSVLSDDKTPLESLTAAIADAVDENWQETWNVSMFSLSLTGTDAGQPAAENIDFIHTLVEHNGDVSIQPGQLVNTGAYHFYLGLPYFLPAGDPAERAIRQWEDFKTTNQDYFVGQLYPDFYYYLTGGWIRGSTLSQYELPCHFVYYRSK